MRETKIYYLEYWTSKYYSLEDIDIDNSVRSNDIKAWMSRNIAAGTIMHIDNIRKIKRHIECFPTMNSACVIWNQVYKSTWMNNYYPQNSLPLTWEVTIMTIAEADAMVDRLNRKQWLVNMMNAMKWNTISNKRSILKQWLYDHIINNMSPLFYDINHDINLIVNIMSDHLSKCDDLKSRYREFLRIWFINYAKKYGIN